jgi:NAD-dependent SIR2 family protein deacetylase
MMSAWKPGASIGTSFENPQSVAAAIVEGMEQDALSVIRGGEARLAMIALNQSEPEKIDERYALRPDVVLFGELLPHGAFEFAAQRASRCELCIVIGTSGLVYPAASLPELAKSAGAFVCEINPEPTGLSSFCDEVIAAKAGDVLAQL